MSNAMNRKEWLRSSGALLAGGLSVFSTGFIPREKSIKEIKRDITSTRVFISDADYARIAPQNLQARLNANENPFGPSEAAKEAFLGAINEGNRYSFGGLRGLGTKIQEHEGLERENLLMAAGSSPILTAGAIYYGQAGGNIVTGDPSYSDMPSKIEKFGTEVRWVPLTSEYKVDLKAMEAKIDENTKMVYVCNPNNPTATMVDSEELKAFCKRVSKKATVFVDEAYIEFQDDMDSKTMMGLIKEGYDVIVARTFSKLYGFAGLRVGYMASTKENIEKFEPYTRGAMSISGPAAAAAGVTYLEPDYMKTVRTKIKDSKEHLYATLKKEGYEYVPSDANFVIFPINMDTRRFMQEMWKRGVGIRTWEFDDKNWCRISIGEMHEMETFAKAFHQIS